MERRFLTIVTVFLATIMTCWFSELAVSKDRVHTNNLILFRQVSVSWDEVTLEEVFEWLSVQGEYNVVVSWKDLHTEGIDRDTLITLKLKDVPVRVVLSEVLESISKVDPVVYYVYGNIVKISTKSAFGSKLYTRVYNIGNLLSRLKDFRDAPEINLERQQGNVAGGRGDQVQVASIFGNGGGGNSGNDNKEDDNKERRERLIRMIQLMIEPKSWQDNGGLGSISVFNNQLIVRNTVNVHIALVGFFEG